MERQRKKFIHRNPKQIKKKEQSEVYLDLFERSPEEGPTPHTSRRGGNTGLRGPSSSRLPEGTGHHFYDDLRSNPKFR